MQLGMSIGQAQGLVAVVNGEPITSYDVDQRIKLERVVGRRTITRAQAIDGLIDDAVKISEGRRLGMRLNDAFLEDSLSKLATNNRQTQGQFEETLRRAGVDPATMKQQIRVNTIWSEVVRNRLRFAAPTNSEVEAALSEKDREGGTRVVDYKLQSIIFVVQRDGGANSVANRERDARAATARFDGCDAGIAAMRELRDVAVREPVTRSSAQMSDQLRTLVEKVPVGRTTAPFRSEQGVEVIAVCSRSDRVDNISARNQVEARLRERQSTAQAEALLKELRSKATIERR
jgi:peptidyl-prolyl cis-trans isomerase SurA